MQKFKITEDQHVVLNGLNHDILAIKKKLHLRSYKMTKKNYMLTDSFFVPDFLSSAYRHRYYRFFVFKQSV